MAVCPSLVWSVLALTLGAARLAPTAFGLRVASLDDDEEDEDPEWMPNRENRPSRANFGETVFAICGGGGREGGKVGGWD